MKTLRFLLLALFVAFFAACNDDDNNDDQNQGGDNTSTEIIYIVATSVGGDNPYAQENVSVVVEEHNDSIDLEMKKVKFAERMPEMDITIPGITVEGTALSGDGIIPTAMGGPFPAYTITNLTGTITDKSISLEMMCGTYPLSFSGTLQE